MDKFGKLNIIPDKETQQIFISGKLKRLPSDLTKGTIRGLEYIHYTVYINDLLVPLSNRLHALMGHSPEVCLNAQHSWDLWDSEKRLHKELSQIHSLNAA